MPFKRKFFKKRRPATLRRRFKRRALTVARSFPRASNVHTFIRKARYGVISLAQFGTGYSAFGYTFALSNAPGYTELTTLYDQFRINWVKLWIVCRFNVTTQNEAGALALGMPQMIYHVDSDDATAPAASDAGMDTIRECRNSKGFSFGTNRTCSIFIRPAVLASAYETAVTTAYSPRYGQWIDCQNSNTPHYGLKGVLQIPLVSGTLPNKYDFDVFATYSISMRAPR